MKRANMIRLQSQDLVIEATRLNGVSGAMKLQGALERVLNTLCDRFCFLRSAKSSLSAHPTLLC